MFQDSPNPTKSNFLLLVNSMRHADVSHLPELFTSTRQNRQHGDRGRKRRGGCIAASASFPANSASYRIKISVGVSMGFRFMAWMVMVMGSVVTRVVMVVYLGSPAVGVLVQMFVQVLMGVNMGVLMAVHFAVMGMFVGVRMNVVMRMQMLVFVLSFHNYSSLS
jgi:hypothetical protein